ncbi:MAG: hypothetical protein Q4E35_08625 [Eubacteriales bacterium]|nr:hypothetical protein [Eubacteriales bacterium]
MENLDKDNPNAISDDELDDVNGGRCFIVSNGMKRENTAVFSSTLEDRVIGKKKRRGGIRLETLETRPDDAQGTPIEWL